MRSFCLCLGLVPAMPVGMFWLPLVASGGHKACQGKDVLHLRGCGVSAMPFSKQPRIKLCSKIAPVD
ncbi:hypothetical protein DV515_00009592 [Chloebia gouldiae]|uniref:Secreted protein n=1 Tax=Chloebia gouldiae TaxID=44316 RepID=A0A3L8SD33_CHLGU|nr:hypothetical protein DV515_00009592 [Chloebia gouldiae]